MNRDVLARIRFTLPPEKRPSGGFRAQARLDEDGADHPYGRWSLAVEPAIEPDCLRKGQRFDLFFGTSQVGWAVVTSTSAALAKTGTSLDNDFLAHPEAA
jgi:hypothetical protein